MIETSNDTAKLDEALAKAQGEIAAASKDSTNPAFKSRYADITSIWEAARPALAKHGISVTQWPVHADDTRLHIVTRVAFKGEWIRAHFSIPVTKNDAQGYGSATTYAKRYALAAALGVVADDDDDGNAASQRPAYEPKKAAAPIPTDVESIGDTFIRKFNEAATSEAFEEEVTKARAAWSRFGVADKAKVQNSIAARRAFWQQAPAAEAAE
jgi:hypothetical protein